MRRFMTAAVILAALGCSADKETTSRQTTALQPHQPAIVAALSVTPVAVSHELTREVAATTIATSADFMNPHPLLRCVRELLRVDGVSTDSAATAIVDFEWHWKWPDGEQLTSDEEALRDHAVASRAWLRKFDDGWRIEKIQNLSGTDSTDTKADLNVLSAEMRAQGRILDAQYAAQRGSGSSFAGGQEHTVAAIVYLDQANGVYHRLGCPSITSKMVKTPRAAAAHQGAAPAADCAESK